MTFDTPVLVDTPPLRDAVFATPFLFCVDIAVFLVFKFVLEFDGVVEFALAVEAMVPRVSDRELVLSAGDAFGVVELLVLFCDVLMIALSVLALRLIS